MNKIYYLSILFLAFLSCKTSSENTKNHSQKTQSDKIDNLANRYLELERFSGVILISKEDSIIYNKNFGLADYENGISFSDKTAFKIGRLTQMITANIVKDMADNGKIHLTDQVSTYLPEIKADLTINDLLNHNTKLPSIQIINEQNPQLNYATVEHVNLAIDSGVEADKSDLNYNLLGLLIEEMSNVSFQEVIEQYSSKLGLENTYFEKQDAVTAVGYLYHNYRGEGLELQKSPSYIPKIAFSSYGLKSTAGDLLKILNDMLDKKVNIDGYLDNDGFSYSIHKDPETKTNVIILSNRKHPVAKEISDAIRAILQNREYNIPLQRKPVDINPKLLKDYAGTYSVNENFNLDIVAENDSLFVFMGPNKIHLVPQSQNQFYMEQSDASMRFLRDTSNTVTRIVLLDGFLEGNEVKRTQK